MSKENGSPHDWTFMLDCIQVHPSFIDEQADNIIDIALGVENGSESLGGDVYTIEHNLFLRHQKEEHVNLHGKSWRHISEYVETIRCAAHSIVESRTEQFDEEQKWRTYNFWNPKILERKQPVREILKTISPAQGFSATRIIGASTAQVTTNALWTWLHSHSNTLEPHTGYMAMSDAYKNGAVRALISLENAIREKLNVPSMPTQAEHMRFETQA